MQVNSEPGFEKRAQYYAAKAYVEQRGKNQAYQDLKRVTFLAITSHTLFKDKKAYLSHHHIRDIETLEHDLVEFGFTFLELPKFKKKKTELSSLIEKWAYFLKNAPLTTETDLRTIIGNDAIIERAYEEMNQFNWSDAELRTYNSVDMKRWAEQSVLEGAKAEGVAIGKAEGKAEGIAIAEAKGEAKLAQREAEIVHNLHHLGLDRQAIGQATGFSQEKVQELLVENR